MPMVKTVLSQDYLGICLITAKGDLNMTLGEIARLVEKWEKESCRYFGTGDPDFRNLLRWLVYDWENPGKWENHINEVPLKEVALKMLSYRDTYCNDEGENWCPHTREDMSNYYIRELFDGDKNAYLDKLAARNILINFFKNHNNMNSTVKDVLDLMNKANINKDLLYKCSDEVHW